MREKQLSSNKKPLCVEAKIVSTPEVWVSLSPRSCSDVSGVAASLVLNLGHFPSLSTEISLLRAFSHQGTAELVVYLKPICFQGSLVLNGHLCSPMAAALHLRLRGDGGHQASVCLPPRRKFVGW